MSTKKLILETFKSMLKERPLENVSVLDITTSMGVTRQTFYYHFGCLYDILKWSVGDSIVNSMHGKGDLMRTDPMTFIDLVAQSIKENEKLVAAFLPTHEDQMRRDLYKYVEKMSLMFTLSSLKGIVDESTAETIARIHASGISGFLERWMAAGMDSSIFNQTAAIRKSYDKVLSAPVVSRITENYV